MASSSSWGDGALDFPALLQRMASTGHRARQLAAAHPANYVVFDLLAIDRRDLRREPLRLRRRHLQQVLADAHPSWGCCEKPRVSLTRVFTGSGGPAPSSHQAADSL